MAQSPTGEEGLSPGLRRVAEALHASLMPLRNTPNLEVEVRLCKLAVPVGSDREPRILGSGPARGKLTVGVSRAHWDAIQAYLQATLSPTADGPGCTPHPPPPVEVTEDVTVGSTRHTYRFPPAGTQGPVTLVESLGKVRKLVRDVQLPCCAYDLRLSASVESPQGARGVTQAAAAAGAPPSLALPVARGGPYRRRKARTTYTDGTYRYDCTVVHDSAGKSSYEVEVEGVFVETSTELTLAWVEGLVRRVATLAALETIPATPDAGPSSVHAREDSTGNPEDAPPRKRVGVDSL